LHLGIGTKSNSIGAQYVTLQVKITEEKSKYAILALQNGLDPAYLLSLQRLVEGTAKPYTCQRNV
jgi:hypothetical protein